MSKLEEEGDVLGKEEEDDDGIAFGGAAGAGSSGTPGGVGVIALTGLTETGRHLKEEEEAEQRGDDVRIRLEIEGKADGPLECTFPIGQTVTMLKVHVFNETGIELERQQLFLEDKLMFDPLSLNDFPSISATAVTTVLVKVSPPAEE